MGVDRETFRRLLEPLCVMFRVTFDVAQWTVYYQALADVPASLLEAAGVTASQVNSGFMPRPGELRSYAEDARRRRLAERPWSPCEECQPLKGFIEITDAGGVKRLTRCSCFTEHRLLLEAAGVPSASLLTAASLEREDAALWSAVPAQPAPADVSQQALGVLAEVKTIARRHRMGGSTLPPQTDPDGQPLPERPRRRR